MRRLLLFAATLLLVAFRHDAFAAPCAQFQDLDDSSSFCGNVAWLKNRAITLGCTTAPVALYCPGDKVLRSSMAAFLNRFANAMTPATEGGIVFSQSIDLDTSPVVCAQPQFAVTGYPRLAHGHAVVSLRSLSGTAQIGVTFVESTDNGANYAPVSPTHGTDVALNASSTVAIILPPRVLDVGSSYRYGLRFSRLGGVGVPGVNTALSCEIKVFFENRNGTIPPFDEHS